MTSLGSANWGTEPVIGLSFAYEKQRDGANMKYRCKITVDPCNGYNYYGYPIYLELTIAGVSRVTKTLKDASPYTWDSAITYTSSWYTVANKTSGTTSVKFRVYSGMGSSRNTTYSYSMPIDPAGSVLSASNGTLGTAQTLSATRYTSSFTHTLTYTCGTASGTIAEKSTATSFSWTPPLSLASQNTTGTSVSVKLTLNTYSGSTFVGPSSTKTITCSIPSSVKPSVSFTLTDVNGIDDIYGSPVQGLSAIKIELSETLAYGSAIASRSISVDGNTYTTAPVTTPVLKTAGDSPVTATIKDKRGRSGSVSYTMKVQAYNAPSITSLTVHRCDADGTENDQGDYIQVKFSAAVTSLSSKNTAAYSLKYKKNSASAWTTKTFTELNNVYAVTDKTFIFEADESSAYDVEVSATDRHSTTTRQTSASTAFSLMDFHPSGTGLRFGGVASKENALQNDLALVQTGNRYSFSSPGVASEEGYVLMARLTHIAANADTPITFVFTRRLAATPMTVHVQFKSNSTTVDPEIQGITYEGSNYGAFLIKSSTSVWDLYVQKVSAYDTITMQDWYSSATLSSRLTVSFPGGLVETLPDPYYRATPAQLQSLVDFIYPVGSIYLSYSHVSPAELFGGTWVRIEDRFLWATTASGTIGATGGSKTHTLTVDEMPSHRHTTNGIPTSKSAGAWEVLRSAANSHESDYSNHYTAYTGGGKAHNNMPPYIQISAWRRTA